MRTELLRFNGAVERDPTIDAWMKEHPGELGAIAHEWFEVMRKCGDKVRELLHDGCPVACLGDAPFGYVNVFTSHVNVGFYLYADNGAIVRRSVSSRRDWVDTGRHPADRFGSRCSVRYRTATPE
jgi:hypothetical protein